MDPNKIFLVSVLSYPQDTIPSNVKGHLDMARNPLVW